MLLLFYIFLHIWYDYIFLHIHLFLNIFKHIFIISSFIRLLRMKIQEIISKLDPETSIAIGKALNIMLNETLKII